MKTKINTTYKDFINYLDFISYKINFDYFIEKDEQEIVFFEKRYDKYIVIDENLILFKFNYDSKLFCYNLQSDVINISIKDSNYIDFLSDLYNFFKIKTLK